MRVVRASREVSEEVAAAQGAVARAAPVAFGRGGVPDRVYVRREQHGRVLVRAWGIEHGGLRSEVVEPVVAGRPSGSVAIERDLRRGVRLF
jgi:hypothetical protein